MNRRNHRILIVAVAILLASAAAFAFLGGQKDSPRTEAVFDLRPPAFVGQALAGNSPIGAYLDSEAGIAAYYDSGYSINLNNARNAFRTIETETSDYIIGSVQVTNQVEHFDPHVYVNKNGWIMAYYLRPDPVSKIIDTGGKTISSTLLKTVVGKVASESGVPFTDVTYYDFRYPNATKIILVAEDSTVGDNNFTIKIPGTYGYYERGWKVSGYPSNSFYFNGVNKPNKVYEANYQAYGAITASQLLPDVDHEIRVGGYGVLVIVYRDQ